MVLEANNEEVIEELYQLYCAESILNAVELSINDFDILSYSFNYNNTPLSVKIQENPKVISGNNTTGLRTWEAAIYLSNYILQNEHLVQNSSVLELGAGTGLVSMSLLKSKIPSSVIITDGSPDLFDNLNASLNLNNLAGKDNLKCHQYLWGHQETEGALAQADYLVGADITYDSSILEDLLITILDFFHYGTKAAYIAATVRNESTITDWENVLTKSFNWEVIDQCTKPELLNTNYWYKPGTPEIKIYKIYSIK
jgi:predicted nicotinamide N-methyase